MMPVSLSTPLYQVFDVIKQLSLHELEIALDVMKNRYHEMRQEQITQNILEARAEYERGELKPMNVEEAMRALNE
jgi:hypothetical protein